MGFLEGGLLWGTLRKVHDAVALRGAGWRARRTIKDPVQVPVVC